MSRKEIRVRAVALDDGRRHTVLPHAAPERDALLLERRLRLVITPVSLLEHEN